MNDKKQESKINKTEQSSAKSGAKKQNRNRRRSKGKAEKNNFQDKFAKREFDKGVDSVVISSHTGGNASSWYKPSEQLAADVANVPFNMRTGYPFDRMESLTFDSITDGYTGDKSNVPVACTGQQLPGIMVYHVAHTIGNASQPTDPVNLAGNNLYSRLQKTSGRRPRYEMADLMIAEIAISEAYAFYAWITRLYGSAQPTSIMNQYLPAALIGAQGVDYNSLKDNLAEFRTFINQFAYALDALPLINNIDYVQRRTFLYQSVYKDANSDRAQLYLYNPKGFYVLREGQESNPITSLEFVELGIPDNTGYMEAGLTIDDIITYGWTLINAIRASQDIRDIAADVLNTFGSSNIYSVNPIAETYEVHPEYNAEVLTQFENAFIWPNGEFKASITQNPAINNGCLVSDYEIYPIQEQGSVAPGLEVYRDLSGIQAPTGNVILNFHNKTSLSVDDVLVATRLANNGFNKMVSVGDDEQHKMYMVPTEVGSELIVGAHVVFYRDSRPTNQMQDLMYAGFNTFLLVLSQFDDAQFSGWSLYGLSDYNNLIGNIETFDWHPMIRPVNVNVVVTNDVPTLQGLSLTSGLMDIEDWTFISERQLHAINTVAMEGLFEVK